MKAEFPVKSPLLGYIIALDLMNCELSIIKKFNTKAMYPYGCKYDFFQNLAIDIGHIKLVPLLIKSIDVNARNSGGLTALHMAVMDNDLELSLFLFSSGYPRK